MNKRSQSFFETGQPTDSLAWQGRPPSPTTESALSFSPHSYLHQEVRDLVNEHPSFQRARILSTEIYKVDDGVAAYYFLIVDLLIGTTKFYLRIDGRKIVDDGESDPFGITGNVVRLVAKTSFETSFGHLY